MDCGGCFGMIDLVITVFVFVDSRGLFSGDWLSILLGHNAWVPRIYHHPKNSVQLLVVARHAFYSLVGVRYNGGEITEFGL
jgi:hypothetical protein